MCSTLNDLFSTYFHSIMEKRSAAIRPVNKGYNYIYYKKYILIYIITLPLSIFSSFFLLGRVEICK